MLATVKPFAVKIDTGRYFTIMQFQLLQAKVKFVR